MPSQSLQCCMDTCFNSRAYLELVKLHAIPFMYSKEKQSCVVLNYY